MTIELDNQCFGDFLKKASPDRYSTNRHSRLLIFDPGETTGVAVFNGSNLVSTNQFKTKNRSTFHKQFQVLIKHYKPNFVLFEDYRVYGWKRNQHAWSDLHTPKIIGQIEALCGIHNLCYHSQMAFQAKQFCSDERLKEWGLYSIGLQHGRDAVRHGCYFLLFGKKGNPNEKPLAG